MQNKVSFQQALMAGLYALIIATVGNVIVFYVSTSLNALTSDFLLQDGKPLTVFHAIFSTVMSTVVAILVFYLLERFTKMGYKLFLIVSVIIFVLFAIPPFQIPGVSTAYAIALEVMHVVVVVPLLFFINRAVNAAKAS